MLRHAQSCLQLKLPEQIGTTEKVHHVTPLHVSMLKGVLYSHDSDIVDSHQCTYMYVLVTSQTDTCSSQTGARYTPLIWKISSQEIFVVVDDSYIRTNENLSHKTACTTHTTINVIKDFPTKCLKPIHYGVS